MGVSWKGSISFGLIYIPVSLYVATRKESIGFNMLHKDCHMRIHYKKVCDYCDKEVKSNDIVKGYNYEDDKYVIFTNDDLEKIKTPKDKNIHILQFVDISEIDPVFYEKAYFIVPNGGEKAYELLKKALSETNKVGIAKVVFGTKETLVALRVAHDKMILNTLYFVQEINSIQVPYINIDLNQAEVDLAKQLIMQMVEPFSPEKYHDEYLEKLKVAIEQKIEGKEISVPKEKEEKNIINLMDALQESIKQTTQTRV
ncbi:Ku protein [Mycoplasmatota bacterium]|nr:Ku protein [Mycoplasmatota bacterium]